jgi:pyruvate ferredoxin oxidoreductase gamma subunit
MIGALLKATGLVKMESMIKPLEDRFGRLAERNINSMKKAYQDAQIKELG